MLVQSIFFFAKAMIDSVLLQSKVQQLLLFNIFINILLQISPKYSTCIKYSNYLFAFLQLMKDNNNQS